MWPTSPVMVDIEGVLADLAAEHFKQRRPIERTLTANGPGPPYWTAAGYDGCYVSYSSPAG